MKCSNFYCENKAITTIGFDGGTIAHVCLTHAVEYSKKHSSHEVKKV